MSPMEGDDPLYVAVNSARVCVERFRQQPQSIDLLLIALRELDDAIGLLDNTRGAAEEIVWLRNQMGDVRGMQSDGATPEEMDYALGRALQGKRARREFDRKRNYDRRNG